VSPYPGKNQHIILKAVEHDLEMSELVTLCVPEHMTLHRFDYALGTLLRKRGIFCTRRKNASWVIKGELSPLTVVDIHLLACLVQGECTREQLVMQGTRALNISEIGVRMALSRLRKREYVAFMNSPRRAVQITQAGIDALGDRDGV
jgi:hypothetical protein